MTSRAAIRAILFDKDGTLTDFHATWDGWVGDVVADLAEATGACADRVADAIGYDRARGRLRPDGRFVTATNAETLAALAAPTGWSVARLSDWLGRRPDAVHQVPAVRTGPLLAGLRDRGLRLGVLTNADRIEAEAHLDALGAWPHLDALVAADDGHGAKPDPAGARAFAAAMDLDPGSVLVVGDGWTDAAAARGAGMPFVAVLTGTAGAAAFPDALAVLPDIGHLPRWLDGRG